MLYIRFIKFVVRGSRKPCIIRSNLYGRPSGVDESTAVIRGFALDLANGFMLSLTFVLAGEQRDEV